MISFVVAGCTGDRVDDRMADPSLALDVTLGQRICLADRDCPVGSFCNDRRFCERGGTCDAADGCPRFFRCDHARSSCEPEPFACPPPAVAVDAAIAPDASCPAPPDASCPAPPDASCPAPTPTSDEALFELDRLAQSAKAYYLAQGHFPDEVGEEEPSTTACGTVGGENVPQPNAWTSSGWTALGFAIDIPNRFNYTYGPFGSDAATATALGDLDCDGISITYTLNLAVGSNGPTATLIPPTNPD
jgi:hypothetical protein